MSAAASNEQRFVAAVGTFGLAVRDLGPHLQQMDAWLGELMQALHTHRLHHAGLQADSMLARSVHAINAGVQTNIDAWREAWTRLASARSLAHALEDKAIFLVFGKFNAGKSSLCNFLAERFRLQGASVQYFHVVAGAVQQTPERFSEGATETTTRLQGVCLGERLVLLDTPGLHSATAENAALTQRFLDSADAVLWLTSATSPGQVQELDGLAQELRRNKPLLPVVTRSDCIEEDEVGGEIQKLLRNKSMANRALQEADVQARAIEKLRTLDVNTALLKAPVSVSAHMAREQGQGTDALAEAGFERLYGALLRLAEPALAYKQRKPAEIMLHHLEESVLGSLHTQTLPALAALRQELQHEHAALEQRQARVVQGVWRSVIPELPRLLERHAPSQNAKAVCAEASLWLGAAFEQQVGEHLGSYCLPQGGPVNMVLDDGVGYEPITAGAGLVEETLPPAAAIGYERLHAALERAVHHALTDLAAKAMERCGEILSDLEARTEAMQNTLLHCEQRLAEIRQRLRQRA